MMKRFYLFLVLFFGSKNIFLGVVHAPSIDEDNKVSCDFATDGPEWRSIGPGMSVQAKCPGLDDSCPVHKAGGLFDATYGFKGECTDPDSGYRLSQILTYLKCPKCEGNIFKGKEKIKITKIFFRKCRYDIKGLARKKGTGHDMEIKKNSGSHLGNGTDRDYIYFGEKKIKEWFGCNFIVTKI